jgi:hypothetical protein
MKILLTFDLELFFGQPTGSVEKCMVYPTLELLRMAGKEDAKLTFFWDVGHFLAIQKFLPKHQELKADYIIIKALVKQIAREGHDLQLHIHPHWEKADWLGDKWQIDADKHYKFSNFSKQEQAEMFSKYHKEVQWFAENKVNAFRAGGWCIQPFEDFESHFKEHGIKIDSSVMPGAKFQAGSYNYDFTEAPQKDQYTFSVDPCVEDLQGPFLQVPITSAFYSPLFFWNLYVRGRLNRDRHRMLGDGNFIAQPGAKSKGLRTGKVFHASTDGYFASSLSKLLRKKEADKSELFLAIGHPKSCTRFSLKKTKDFIKENRSQHDFVKISELA